jgi:Spy/CpxP family protein refolding chaperone
MLPHLKAALIALALVLSCSAVFAQGDPPGPPPDGPGAMGPRGNMQWGGGHGRGDWGRENNEGRGEHEGFGRDRGMGMRRGGMRGRESGLGRLLNDPAIREQLGVSADQALKIRQQESEFRKTEIRGRADLEVKQIDLRDLLSADKPDRAAIDAKLQDISTARLALEKSAITFRLDSRDALTPAQREKLRQIMRDRNRPGDGPRAHGPGGAGRGGPRASAPPAKPPAPAPPSQ